MNVVSATEMTTDRAATVDCTVNVLRDSDDDGGRLRRYAAALAFNLSARRWSSYAEEVPTKDQREGLSRALVQSVGSNDVDGNATALTAVRTIQNLTRTLRWESEVHGIAADRLCAIVSDHNHHPPAIVETRPRALDWLSGGPYGAASARREGRGFATTTATRERTTATAPKATLTRLRIFDADDKENDLLLR